MKNNLIRKMTFAAMITAVYFVLCVIEGYLASGPVANIRFAEGLLIFTLFIPETVIGVTIGCFIYNLFFGFGIFDALIGGTATILGGLFVLLIKKIINKEGLRLGLFGIGAGLFNAILVPMVLIISIPELNWGMYLYEFMIVGVGELMAVYGVGIPLYFASRKFFEYKNVA